ncbi:MAG: hypothetical protein ACI8TQ_003385 [Planctomycetota bacterium]
MPSLPSQPPFGRPLAEDKTVIDKELLEILACPETHQKLAEAGDDVLAAINAKISAGEMKNVGGEAVTDPIEAGLVREDGTIVYPIRDAIPVLLIDEGLTTSAS